MRSYPTNAPSSAPSSGRFLYGHLMRKIKIPAASGHHIWYAGQKAALDDPENKPFRGVIPVGGTLELITLEGKAIELGDNVESASNGRVLYTFTGNEDYVLVSDLAQSARDELAIPPTAREKDKVFNANFVSYEKLPNFTRWSNELAAMSVPKSISTYLAGTKGKLNYSERDVLGLLEASFENLSGPEMMHFLSNNHLAWASLNYVQHDGNVEGDLMVEFHGQNPVDFYSKDLGTVMPGMFYALALLGEDPVLYFREVDMEIWGLEDAARFMQQFMPELGELRRLKA